MSNEHKASSSNAREYASSILVAVGLAILIRTTVVQAFFIPSGSMEDTLLVGDYLLANKFIYGAPIDIIGTNINLGRLPAIQEPQPGDIVIFRSTQDEDRDLIKRCVAVGGQEIKIVDKILYVDGVRFEDPPLSKYDGSRSIPGNQSNRDNFIYRVPEDHLFMMGDNRDNSHDSRFMGPIPYEKIKGKAMIIYWSWDSEFRTPIYRGPASLPKVVGGYLWSIPSRIRFSRLGDIIL